MQDNTWNLVKLGDVCKIVMEQSPPGHTYNKVGNGLPFYQEKINFGEVYLESSSTWCTEPIKIAEPNDILISVRAPVGPTNICNVKCCIGRGLAAIRPQKDVDNWFIFYFFRSLEPEISNSGSSSPFSAISKSQIYNLKIPLPPLPVQHRIATELKEKMAYVEKLKSALEALPQAILRKAFRGEL